MRLRPLRPSRGLRRFLAATCALLAWAEGAHAQNLRDVPLGARTATMGGAGVATGIDSAMPFLNPAGIAGTPIDTLSVSATAYSFVTASVPVYFRPNGLSPAFGTDRVVEEESSTSQLAALPTGLAYYLHFGDETSPVVHVLGISISVPSYEDRALDATLAAEGAGGNVSAKQISSETFRMAVFGPSYAVRFGDRLRLGASLFGYYSDATFDEHLMFGRQATGEAGPRFVNQRTQVSAESFGLLGVVGAQARLVGDLWGGLALESRGVPLVGGGEIVRTADSASFDQSGAQIAARGSAIGSLDFAIARPFRLSAGLAYELPSRFTIAADVHVHPPISDVIRGTGTTSAVQVQTGQAPAEARAEAAFRVGSKTVVNPSIGAEWQPFEKVAFRAGVFTDFDAREDSSNGRPNGRLDWYGVSFGVGHKTDPLGATYGVVYRFGRGVDRKDDVLGPDPTQAASIDYDAHGVMVVLSATFEIGAPVDVLARARGARFATSSSRRAPLHTPR